MHMQAGQVLFVYDYTTHELIREATAADIEAATDPDHIDHIGYLDPSSPHNHGMSDFIARGDHGEVCGHAMIRPAR
jgi:hypothetical protein